MHIANVTLPGRLLLAPMAGVTDLAFREVCRAHGAALSVSEMVSTKALLFQDAKSRRLLRLAPNEAPAAVQIFGHEPEIMAEGAKKAAELSGCQIIDINMGCPAPKIVNNGDGSALMRNPALAARIIEAVARAVSVPVTVKMRLGWDESTRNYLEFAHMAQESGAQMLCVHGRTRSRQYGGVADWDAIAQVKARARVPVVANGDVFTPQDAVRILEHTGADGAMIGRGALGNPWIFERGNALLAGLPLPPLPPLSARLRVAQSQIARAAEDKGERAALLEARKQMGWYLKGAEHMKTFKVRATQLTSLAELSALIAEISAADEIEQGGSV